MMSDKMRAIIHPRASSTLTDSAEGKNVRWAYTMEKCKSYKIKNL